ncbi:MAG: glycosyltransferase [Bacteroidales bacterium]|nr:glycosyltransferase [Bacteroidales bacterium]
MPAYKAKFLHDAIDSIISQTMSDWELVIVDDCSPDDLKSVVDSFDDSRLRYYRNKKNLGGSNLVNQWNYCITLAKGDWIVLAADDDIYAPTFCEDCFGLIEKYPEVDLIRSRVEQIDEEGNHLWDDGHLSEFTNKYEFLHDWITAKAFSCIGNYAFRRSSLMQIGGFMDFPCAFGSDIATPIALSLNGVANTEKMLFKFRQSTQHLSADTSRFKEKLAGITQLSQWLRDLDYGEPDNEKDARFYSVHSKQYLHDKCVYDYFHLVIKYLPLRKLNYLKLCPLASTKDKMMMILRWVKHRILG